MSSCRALEWAKDREAPPTRDDGAFAAALAHLDGLATYYVQNGRAQLRRVRQPGGGRPLRVTSGDERLPRRRAHSIAAVLDEPVSNVGGDQPESTRQTVPFSVGVSGKAMRLPRMQPKVLKRAAALVTHQLTAGIDIQQTVATVPVCLAHLHGFDHRKTDRDVSRTTHNGRHVWQVCLDPAGE